MNDTERGQEESEIINIKKSIEVYREIKGQFHESEFKVKDRVVYHYTSPDGLSGIINKENIILWFSQINCLNDKAEGKHVYELYTQVLLKAYQDNLISVEFFHFASKITSCEENTTFVFKTKPITKDGPFGKQTLEWDVALLPYSIYLCCFSKNSDSLPMWNYYNKSSGCRGYNVGIRVQNLLADFPKDGCNDFSIRKVIYSTREKTTLLKMLILAAYHNYGKIENETLLGIIESFLDEWRLLFKSEFFEHEKEIRAILKVPHEQPNQALVRDDFETGLRQNNGYIIPYVVVKRGKTILTNITIGPLLDFESAENGVNSLLRLHKYKNVIVKRSEILIRY
jgi:hypothetical protein